MTESYQPAKVFISYSWDDDNHREWVRKFATRLREDGIETILDRWHVVPGEQIPEFMERAVRESDFVLCICTPKYKDKSDQRGGGVGYEGDVMTSEVFINRNQRKFIPILRKGEWRHSAPSWFGGKYFIDLSSDPYSEKNYNDLLATLRGEREEAPPIGGSEKKDTAEDKSTFEFVNRDIELSTLDPEKLRTSYWQVALVSGPTGYGKTRLMHRLMDTIHQDPQLNVQWNCCYIDLSECIDLDLTANYAVELITGQKTSSNLTDLDLKNKLCNHILDKMSESPDGKSLRNILFILDSIDYLTPVTTNWFASVINDVIVGSYIDYEKDNPSFAVRIILTGVDTEAFWQNYQKWESGSGKYRLKPPKRLPLSAFDELAVQDMVNRRAKKEGVSLSPEVIANISYELLFLSGGHPQVVSAILGELAGRQFRMYKEYCRNNREQLIKNYISVVVKKILRRFPLPQAQKDIKTICVFRLIDLNTLQGLRDGDLVAQFVDIKLLGQLCDSKILNPPNAGKLFYHDDIIRRILHLDLAYGYSNDSSHVECVHKCARSLYRKWIENSHHSLHYFFVEWLFHSLQIVELSREIIISEWKSLLPLIQSTSIPLNDLKHAIVQKLESDSEVRYLYRERFGSEDFSRLFDA
jgi:hypothetical protein